MYVTAKQQLITSLHWCSRIFFHFVTTFLVTWILTSCTWKGHSESLVVFLCAVCHY